MEIFESQIVTHRWFSLTVITLFLLNFAGPSLEDTTDGISTTEFVISTENVGSTTTTTTKSTTASPTVSTPSPFCFGPGRHPNTTDATCQRYVYCSPNSTGTSYIAYPFKCTKNYVFRPITSTCVRPALHECIYK